MNALLFRRYGIAGAAINWRMNNCEFISRPPGRVSYASRLLGAELTQLLRLRRWQFLRTPLLEKPGIDFVVGVGFRPGIMAGLRVNGESRTAACGFDSSNHVL